MTAKELSGFYPCTTLSTAKLSQLGSILLMKSLCFFSNFVGLKYRKADFLKRVGSSCNAEKRLAGIEVAAPMSIPLVQII